MSLTDESKRASADISFSDNDFLVAHSDGERRTLEGLAERLTEAKMRHCPRAKCDAAGGPSFWCKPVVPSVLAHAAPAARALQGFLGRFRRHCSAGLSSLAANGPGGPCYAGVNNIGAPH